MQVKGAPGGTELPVMLPLTIQNVFEDAVAAERTEEAIDGLPAARDVGDGLRGRRRKQRSRHKFDFIAHCERIRVHAEKSGPKRVVVNRNVIQTPAHDRKQGVPAQRRNRMVNPVGRLLEGEVFN